MTDCVCPLSEQWQSPKSRPPGYIAAPHAAVGRLTLKRNNRDTFPIARRMHLGVTGASTLHSEWRTGASWRVGCGRALTKFDSLVGAARHEEGAVRGGADG